MVAIASPYKHPKTGVFYFRRAVPKDLRPVLGWEIKRSLRTRDPLKAKQLFVHELQQSELLISSVRATGKKPQDGSVQAHCHQGEDADHHQIPTLTNLFKVWNRERKPAAKTTLEFERAVIRFAGLFGDMPASSISKAMMREYKQALLTTPPVLSAKQRQMPFRKLLNSLEGEYEGRTLSAASVNKHLSGISTVLGWAGKNGYFDSVPYWSNPAIGTKVVQKAVKKREPFTKNDLLKIFNGPVHSKGIRPKGGAGEAAYWIPLIGLYTGARLEEIGQLTVGDVRQEQGVWVFDINAKGDHKSLKNESSNRIVPVHSALIGVGLLKYRDQVYQKGNGQLFPYLMKNKNGALTQGWSKWFGRYLDSVGVTDASKVFHSFRHTMKDALRSVGVDEALSDAITGHSGGGAGRGYGNGYTVSTLSDSLSKIDWPGILDQPEQRHPPINRKRDHQQQKDQMNLCLLVRE